MANLEAFCIIGGALFAAYFGLKLCADPRDREEKLRLWIACTFGVAICLGLGGFLSLEQIEKSDRPHIYGTIEELKEYSGSHGTKSHTLKIRTTDGQELLLQVNYHGKHLREGQQVAITYLAYHRSVLEIKSLSLPDVGWTDEEGDGLRTSRISTGVGSGFGIACLLLSVIRDRSSRAIRRVKSH